MQKSNSEKFARGSKRESEHSFGWEGLFTARLYLRREKARERWRRLRDSTLSSSLLERLKKGSHEDKEELEESIASEEEEEEEEEKESWMENLREMIIGKWINVPLLLMPVAWLAGSKEWNPQMVFWLNFAVLIPLASLLGDFTEELSLHTNEVIGGLINATFGNAVELVVGIQALLADEIRVVQSSMIGSIFSNLLLVLGCCFFFGGLNYKHQTFNAINATANMSLLTLSSISFVLPTPFAEYYQNDEPTVLAISRTAAIFLVFMYFQLLLFQLKTHADIVKHADDENPGLPFLVALAGLLFITLTVAVFSDFLVQSIDGFVASSGISRTFVGIVIFPIVGNAVEHITAVSVAMKDKMDMAMSVAVGSSTQISLFVMPFIVLVGWVTHRNMTLNFPHFEIIIFVMSIFIVSICLSNGQSNWLQGSLLITTFIVISIGFWFQKDV